MSDWTSAMVEERLVESAKVLRRLPSVRVNGYFSSWPHMLIEFSDLFGQTPMPMRTPPPSAAAISRMEAALPWLRWLEPEDGKLVWMRAERKPWKAICWRFGMARSTANRRHEYALSAIAWRLNHRPIPSKWSRRFLVDRLRSLSSEI